MARLIDADALLASEIRRCGRIPTIGTGYINEKDFKSILAEAPTVDAVPVVHGRWVKDEERSKNHIEYIYVCSACENCEAWGAVEKTNYCPYCGAHMDLEVE